MRKSLWKYNKRYGHYESKVYHYITDWNDKVFAVESAKHLNILVYWKIRVFEGLDRLEEIALEPPARVKDWDEAFAKGDAKALNMVIGDIIAARAYEKTMRRAMMLGKLYPKKPGPKK